MNPPEMTIAYLTKDIITAQHQGDKCLISRISCILLDNPGRSGMIGQRTLKGLPRTMAKVALVNPQLASSGWTRGLRPRHMDDLLPRHSLTYLSASLKAAGHTVLLLDLRLLSSWDDYEAALERERPGFVCVTAHTSEMDYALECFARAKRMLPGCVTVGGGIHLTMDPEAGLA
ncbi:MAG TPA: cobalamin B12-binding domain-containing protein, partial [Firmicutes bacterium]|nr:cobalamin B12-binding domain-containing protein [Bacillota bacterium]